MKILHIIGTLNTGGIQKFILELSQTQNLRKFNHQILCTTLSDDSFKYKFQNIKTPIFYLPFKYLPNNHIPFRIDKVFRFIYSLTFGIRLWIFLVKSDQKIIHSHIDTQLMSQVLASLLSRKYIIWTIHGEYILKNRTILFIRFIKYFISDNKFQIIADSNSALKSTLQLSEKTQIKSNIIQTGINLEPFDKKYDKSLIRIKNNIDLDTIIIGSTGRIVWEKGYDQLITLMETLKIKDKKICILIAGDGSLRQKLMDIVTIKQLKDKVVFLGNIKNIPEFLSMLDVYVQPSITEGYPLSVLEAMASGLPIIVSNAGGLKEMIVNGENGIIYKSGDIKELKEALKKMLNLSPHEKIKMGEIALNNITANNSIEKVSEKYKTKYLQC